MREERDGLVGPLLVEYTADEQRGEVLSLEVGARTAEGRFVLQASRKTFALTCSDNSPARLLSIEAKVGCSGPKAFSFIA